jgi:hypothetical protein
MLKLNPFQISLIVIAICASDAADARPRHRAAVATPATLKPANVPEQKRDPADIALDRKIKGICRGC